MKNFPIAKILGSLFVVFVMTSCDSKDEGQDPHGVDDPKAQLYRMFIDNGQGDFKIKKFVGRIVLANWEERFGDTADIPANEQGNYVDTWQFEEGRVWRYVAGPNFKTINIITIDKDGNMSSSFDLDGDRIADLIDIRLANRERFTFVTEQLGLAFFESWLLGENPLCKERSIPGLDYPLINCDNEESSNPSGLPGGGVVDLLEHLCADYHSTPRNRMANMHAYGYEDNYSVTEHDGTFEGRDIDRHERNIIAGPEDAEGRLTSITRTDAYTDAEGNNVVTYRTHVTYEDGEVTSITQETVVGEGQGSRTVTSIGHDGTRYTKHEDFTTDSNDYIDDWGNENPPVGTPSDGASSSHPGPVDGPFGSDSDLAAWCEANTPYESGAEQAARKDPAAFRVSCDDLVGGGTGDDCTIIEWASPADFNGVLEVPSHSTGCGPFQEPGPDGTCATSSTIQRLKGMTAEILSANLGEIVICNPIVCNTGIEL